MRVGVNAGGEIQVVGSGRVRLGAQVEDVAVERRVKAKIQVRVCVSGVIEFQRRVVAGLGHARSVNHDGCRRQIHAVGIAKLNLDGIGAAAFLGEVRIIKRANLIADLVADGSEGGRMEILVAEAPVIGGPNHADVTVV